MTPTNVSRTAPIAGAVLPSTAPAQGAATSLLPRPDASCGDVGDVVTRLLQMSSQMNEQQVLLGKSQIQVADNQRREAAARRKEALDRAVEAARRARESQQDDGPFSFITDNLGATGLLGLATFNVPLVVADITAHRTGLTSNTENVLDLGAAAFGNPLLLLAEQGARKLFPDALNSTSVAAALLGGPMGYALERGAAKAVMGDFEKRVDELTTIKDDDVRLANKVALTLALAGIAATATVFSGGTSAPAIVALIGIGISTTTEVSMETGALKEVVGEKAAGYVALAGVITGSALTVGGALWSLAASTQGINSVSTVVKHTARAVEGTLTATEGVATTVDGIQALKSAGFQHDADRANADAQEQKHLLQRLERMIDGILDDLREAHAAGQRSAETLQNTFQIHHQTLLQAASMKV